MQVGGSQGTQYYTFMLVWILSLFILSSGYDLPFFLAESLPYLHLPSHILPTSGGEIIRQQTMEAMVFGYVRSPDVPPSNHHRDIW